MKNKLSELIFDLPLADLSDYQLEKIEAVEKIVVEARIDELNELYASIVNILKNKNYTNSIKNHLHFRKEDLRKE